MYPFCSSRDVCARYSLHHKCCGGSGSDGDVTSCWLPDPDCTEDDTQFEENVLSWVHDRVVPAAGVMFAVAFLQLFTCIAACTIIGRRKREEPVHGGESRFQ